MNKMAQETVNYCVNYSQVKKILSICNRKARTVEEDTLFSIIGSMQLPFAATITRRMNQGHGLIERMTIIIPFCMMPSSEETKIATEFCKASNMEEVGDIIYELSTMKLQSQFEFEEDTQELIETLNKEFIKETNQAIIIEENPHQV